MLTCPMCKKTLPESTQQCPRCSTDLSLLTDYVEHLHDGVARADDLTRQGQLDEAVWAYLEVLEIDPDNAVARRQVGRVATAVREFDRAGPGRRWLQRLGREARFRHWLYTRLGLRLSDAWIFWLVVAAVLILFFALGFFAGWVARPESSKGVEVSLLTESINRLHCADAHTQRHCEGLGTLINADPH